MASTSETGHAKNIANFKTLIEINVGMGKDYNPSNPLLILAAMQAQHTACDNFQKEVNKQSAIFKPLVNIRQQEFKTLKTLVRRVRNSAKTSGAKKEWLKDINTIVVKILGEKARNTIAKDADVSAISASQLSFDNVTNNFNSLVELLKNEPLYKPNETDLKIATLANQYTTINNANNAVKTGIVPYSKALIARNKALYNTITGLTDVGQNSKDYVRSIFGFNSPEFKLITKAEFKRLVKVE